MLNPITSKALPSEESCVAHVVPAALNRNSVKVRSNKDFDNRFGTLNDSVLIDLVRNRLEGKQNVRVDVFEGNNIDCPSASFRSKARIQGDSRTGRSGTFEISFPKRTSDSWRLAHFD